MRNPIEYSHGIILSVRSVHFSALVLTVYDDISDRREIPAKRSLSTGTFLVYSLVHNMIHASAPSGKNGKIICRNEALVKPQACLATRSQCDIILSMNAQVRTLSLYI
jgi:hypothetical protein